MSRLSKQKRSKVIEILNRNSDEEVAEVWKDMNSGRPVKSGLPRPKRLLLEQHLCDDETVASDNTNEKPRENISVARDFHPPKLVTFPELKITNMYEIRCKVFYDDDAGDDSDGDSGYDDNLFVEERIDSNKTTSGECDAAIDDLIQLFSALRINIHTPVADPILNEKILVTRNDKDVDCNSKKNESKDDNINTMKRYRVKVEIEDCFDDEFQSEVLKPKRRKHTAKKRRKAVVHLTDEVDSEDEDGLFVPVKSTCVLPSSAHDEDSVDAITLMMQRSRIRREAVCAEDLNDLDLSDIGSILEDDVFEESDDDIDRRVNGRNGEGSEGGKGDRRDGRTDGRGSGVSNSKVHDKSSERATSKVNVDGDDNIHGRVEGKGSEGSEGDRRYSRKDDIGSEVRNIKVGDRSSGRSTGKVDETNKGHFNNSLLKEKKEK